MNYFYFLLIARPQGGGENVVQPIFLMPKQAQQQEQKPIYIPRNIYVPVIRPVFVPRERIIVRPQIIHVARPVLVDRPVPVQQRPIVIERDRPIPIRVETIEKIENIETSHSQVSPSKKEVTSYETFQYDDYEKRLQQADERDSKYNTITTNTNTNSSTNNAYYNQAANQSSTYQYTTTSDYNKLYQDQSASSYQYTTADYDKVLQQANRADARSGTNLATTGISQYDTILNQSSRQDLIGGGGASANYNATGGSSYNATGGSSYNATGAGSSNVQYVYEDTYNEELRKKTDLQQLLSDVQLLSESEKRKWDNNKTTTSASYTLEVLDPTVSNKFERVDQSNLKSVYGIDTYQYIPDTTSSSTNAQQQQQQQQQNYSSQVYSSQAYPGDYITSTFQPSVRTSSFRTASHHEVKSTNSYQNLAGLGQAATSFTESVPAGTITNVAQIPSGGGQGLSNYQGGQAPVVIQNVQQMIQNFGPAYTAEGSQQFPTLSQH